MKNDLDILNDAELLFTNKYMNIFFDSKNEVLFCITNIDFVPEEDFRLIFERVAQEIDKKNIKKVIFDKRTLKIFDQPSMVWYHIIWKVAVKAKNGMVTYRKLLPNDADFRLSVEIGKKHLQLMDASFSFADFDIQYVDNLEDALAK